MKTENQAFTTGSEKFWSIPSAELLKQLDAGIEGLSESEAASRLAQQANSQLTSTKEHRDIALLFHQFKNPLTLLLIIAAVLSLIMVEYTNSIIILAIVLFSGILGFWQERNAGRALKKLQSIVQNKISVRRSGQPVDIHIHEVVPGDIVLLNAGDIIPGDCLIIECNDLHTNEASLTGESFPVEKNTGVLPADAAMSKRSNAVFLGTSVINGTATVVAVHIGKQTEFGKISKELQGAAPETEFEKGIRKFGYMLMRITLVLTIIILAVNIYLHRPVVDSILFALALAVGLTPELLPAIVTVTLSAGAQRMAKKQVIVKKLVSIQNFGSIDVLCTDKTGTITQGVVHVEDAQSVAGNSSQKVRQYAFLNAFFETGFTNPLDEAIRSMTDVSAEGFSKTDEVPYDFIRKRLSIVVEREQQHIMITKGALQNVLDVCATVETDDKKKEAISIHSKNIQSKFQELSSRGFRVIGIAYKDVTGDPIINKDDEQEMTFLGFVVFNDPLKEGILETLTRIQQSGISLKILTGDNQYVTRNIAQQLNISNPEILTGEMLRKMDTQALAKKVLTVDLFAEVEPNQKERIVQALQKAGKVVAYMGDGINDASALKASDVGISVESAVDVAKEAADIVLLQKSLDIVLEGIYEGRRTFINTLKYIFITTSANFGNMFSMAGVSMFLQFLPLLPRQILLNNFLTDLPAMAIASDKVDDAMITRPRKWDLKFIVKFMIVFGIQSSIFDFLTFGVLLFLFHASPDLFRSGWFVESVITEILILLVIRTQNRFYKSRPGKLLSALSVLVVAVTIILPYTPLAAPLGLVPLPLPVLAGVIAIALLYIIISEITKTIFFRRVKF